MFSLPISKNTLLDYQQAQVLVCGILQPVAQVSHLYPICGR